jgi:hypothetical protein
MSGYHAVAVRGQVDAAELIRAVYARRAGTFVTRSGEDGFPWGRDDNAAYAHVDGWTLLFGGLPPGLGDAEETAELETLSRGRTLVRWLVERTVGGVGFDLYADGALVRGFLLTEGEIERSDGEPVQGEPAGGLDEVDPYELDEWTVVGVIERHVLPWDRMAQADYQVYTFR